MNDKEKFEQVIGTLQSQGVLSRNSAQAALEGYDGAIAAQDEHAKLKAEDEAAVAELTRDGEPKPRTKSKASS